jgi:hypothetical protein
MQSSSEQARWISEHLKELVQKPVLSELSMGVLRERYFLRPHSDISKSQFDEFKASKIYKRSSVRIAKHLQDAPHILIRGEKRGKTYRHKESRPIFTDQMIAKIIPAILLPIRDEISWNQLYYVTKHWAQLLHESYETHPDFLDLLEDREKAAKFSIPVISMDMETMLPTLIDGKKTIQLALEIDINETMAYRKNFPSELKQWVPDAYSEEWWKKSSSNIQSIMKKEGKAGPGSKRGTWLHTKHKSTNDSIYFVRNQDIIEGSLEKVTNDFKDAVNTIDKETQKLNIIKEINNYMAKLDVILLDLFSQLESERHQVPSDRYSDFRHLKDISERINLVKNRIQRFTLELRTDSIPAEFQINSEAD